MALETNDTPGIDEFDLQGALLDNLLGKAGADAARAEGDEGGTQDERDARVADGKPAVEAPAADTAVAEDDPDDAEFEWKQGEADTKAKLRDLKEAFNERTRAQAEFTAAQTERQRASDEATKAGLAVTKMLERAQARWAPYAEVDFLVLAQKVDPDTLQVIRKEAQDALADVQFYQTELDGARTAHQQAVQTARQAASQEAIRVLSDPKTGLEGWGAPLYGEIITHAERHYGAPRQALLSITDPWAIKVMHDAMQFHKAAAKTAEVAAKVEKVVHKPTKTITRVGTTPAASGDAMSRRDALSRMSDAGGDLDSTADAILASFRS